MATSTWNLLSTASKDGSLKSLKRCGQIVWNRRLSCLRSACSFLTSFDYDRPVACSCSAGTRSSAPHSSSSFLTGLVRRLRNVFLCGGLRPPNPLSLLQLRWKWEGPGGPWGDGSPLPPLRPYGPLRCPPSVCCSLVALSLFGPQRPFGASKLAHFGPLVPE